MAADAQEQSPQPPIFKLQPTKGLKDYFCPYCNIKMFRGDVKQFNMVCTNCNRLVRSDDSKESDQQA